MRILAYAVMNSFNLRKLFKVSDQTKVFYPVLSCVFVEIHKLL